MEKIPAAMARIKTLRLDYEIVEEGNETIFHLMAFVAKEWYLDAGVIVSAADAQTLDFDYYFFAIHTDLERQILEKLEAHDVRWKFATLRGKRVPFPKWWVKDNR